MNTFYSSLQIIPLHLLGKNNKLFILSLSECKELFIEIEKIIFKHFLSVNLEKEMQERTFPIIKDIIFEFYKVMLSIIEIQTCKRMNINVVYDEIHSPIFSKLLNNFEPKEKKLEKNHNYSIKNKIKLCLKKIENKFNIKKEFDLHNQSILLNEFIKEKNIKYNFLWPEIFLSSSTKKKLIKDYLDDKIISILKYLFLRFEISNIYFKRCFLILSANLLKQYQFVDNLYYSFSNTNFNNLISDKLLGGTPQILGRVLNSIYNSNQKKVIRFSHGGERVFFNDKLWILSELINSTEYYTHGKPEKISVENKIKKLPEKLRKLMPTKIKTLGSRKHQIIFESTKRLNSEIKKKLIFIPGCFLGERLLHNPFFKPSDIFLADYIAAFVNQINGLGYEIVIKAHPGGIQQDNFYNSLGVRIFRNTFNLRSYNNSILAFDFAGTAFMDALSSNFPIILINNGARSFSNLILPDLEKRCEIIKPYFSNNNIRFKNKDIKLALKNTIEKSRNFESFSSKFFFKND